jgi:hypothetical protein
MCPRPAEGGFENGGAAWDLTLGYAGYADIVSSPVYAGSGALRLRRAIIPPFVFPFTYDDGAAQSRVFGLTTGESYRVTLQMASNAPYTNYGRVQVLNGAADPPGVVVANKSFSTTTSYAEKTFTFTASAGSVGRLQLVFASSVPDAALTLYYDQIRVTRLSSHVRVDSYAAGHPQRNVFGTVYDAELYDTGDESEYAAIYSDRDLTIPIVQPYLVNDQGFLEFYAAPPKRFIVRLEGPGREQTLQDIEAL